MKRFYFFVLLSTFLINKGFCTVKTAVSSSADWEDGSSWSTGIAPTNGDTLIIPAGKTINVGAQDNYSPGSPIVIFISGTLYFTHGNKLTLPCSSLIAVKSGGKIDDDQGGGSSDYISLCGSKVWKSGDGTFYGPGCLPSSDSRCSAALPVELLMFDAKEFEGSVKLSWITATEINNDFFTIERSKDGVNFEKLANMKGAGNSNTVNSYSLNDTRPYSGISYYRLSQTDFDGKTKVYPAVAVNINTLSIYPNPVVGDILNFSISSAGDQAIVTVLDAVGKEVIAKQSSLADGHNLLHIDLSSVSHGYYTLRVETFEGTTNTKFLK